MMAEPASPIFNKKATDKLRNPDDLDKYVRVTNPSIWVVIGACVILLAGLLAWGFFGVVTTNVTTTGAVVDISKATANIEAPNEGEPYAAVCFLSAENVVQVEVGDEAIVGGVQMKVSYIAPIPAAPDEWDTVLDSQYLVKTLFTGDWAYPVVFKGDVSQLNKNVPLEVSITTERIAPISLILKNW